jgi:hypothetical protein
MSDYILPKRPDTIWRVLWLLLTIALIVMFLLSAFSSLRAYAAEPATKIDINVANAGPREVEETTRAAIQREYGNAWQAMTKSLAGNSDTGLGGSFVGTAKETLLSQLDQQKHNNLSTKIVDRGLTAATSWRSSSTHRKARRCSSATPRSSRSNICRARVSCTANRSPRNTSC